MSADIGIEVARHNQNKTWCSFLQQYGQTRARTPDLQPQDAAGTPYFQPQDALNAPRATRSSPLHVSSPDLTTQQRPGSMRSLTRVARAQEALAANLGTRPSSQSTARSSLLHSSGDKQQLLPSLLVVEPLSLHRLSGGGGLPSLPDPRSPTARLEDRTSNSSSNRDSAGSLRRGTNGSSLNGEASEPPPQGSLLAEDSFDGRSASRQHHRFANMSLSVELTPGPTVSDSLSSPSDSLRSPRQPERTSGSREHASPDLGSLRPDTRSSASRLLFVKEHLKAQNQMSQFSRSFRADRSTPGNSWRGNSNSSTETSSGQLSFKEVQGSSREAQAAAAPTSKGQPAKAPNGSSMGDTKPSTPHGSSSNTLHTGGPALMLQLLAPSNSVIHTYRSDGHPQKLEALRGVTVKYLVDFSRAVAQQCRPVDGDPESTGGLPPRSLTTAEVLKRFIQPHTVAQTCKFIDVIPKRSVMIPSLYISHAHSASFSGLVTSVTRFCAIHGFPTASTAIFIDIFCLNYHAPGMLRECMEQLRAALSLCKHLVLVVDHKGTSLFRLWCCFEAWLVTLPKRRAAVEAPPASAPVDSQGRVVDHRLQVVFDQTDLASIVDALAALDTSRLAVQEEGDRRLLRFHAELWGSECGALPGLLANLRAAMLQTFQGQHVRNAKRKDSFPSTYLQSALYYSNMLVLVGQAWDAEKVLRKDILWAKQRHVAARDLLMLMNNLVLLLRRGNFLDEAERICIEALSLAMEPEGDGDARSPTSAGNALSLLSGPSLALVDHMLLLNMTDVLFHSNDWQRAEELCRLLIKWQRQHKAIVARAVSLPSCHLASILLERDEADAAEKILRDAIDCIHAEDAGARGERASCRYALGTLLMGARQAEEACDVLSKCHKTRLSLYGESHALTLAAAAAHAGVLVSDQQFDQAEMLLEQVYSTAERVLGTQHDVTRALVQHFSSLQDAFTHMAQQASLQTSEIKAEALLRRALRLNAISWSDGSSMQELSILEALSEVLRKQGKMQDRKELLVRMSAISDKHRS